MACRHKDEDTLKWSDDAASVSEEEGASDAAGVRLKPSRFHGQGLRFGGHRVAYNICVLHRWLNMPSA